MFGKLLVQSLCGALDTRASQAYGSGAYDAIGVIFQRTVLFMLAHCIPITLIQLGVPELLKLAGEDPELCALASAYARRLLPSLFLEAFSRCCRRPRPSRHSENEEAVGVSAGGGMPGDGSLGDCENKITAVMGAFPGLESK